MKNLFADYKTSKILKELGFDEICFSAYRNTDGEESLMGLSNWTNSGNGYYNIHAGYCAAPLWQQVKEWLWEKHKIKIESRDYNHGFIGVTIFPNKNRSTTEEYDSPITASTEGIKAAVKWLGEQQLKNK